MYYGNGPSHDIGTSLRAELLAKHGAKPKRTIFKGDMAIHVWAQRTQAYGSNAKGSQFFDGATLYSYGRHFVVARIVDDKHGKPVALVTSERWDGHVTNGHVSSAWRAVSHLPRFRVANPESADYSREFRAMVVAFNEAVAVMRSKRHGHRAREHAASGLAERIEIMRAFVGHFLDARKHKAPAMPADIDAARAQAAFDEARRDYSRASNLLARGPSTKTQNGRWNKPRKHFDLSEAASLRRQVIAAVADMRAAVDAGAVGVVPTIDAARLERIAALATAKRDALKAVDDTRNHYSNTVEAYYGRLGWQSYKSAERAACEAVDRAHAFPGIVQRMRDEIADADGYFAAYNAENTIRDLERVPTHCAEWRLPCPVTAAEIAELSAAYRARANTENAKRAAEEFARKIERAQSEAEHEERQRQANAAHARARAERDRVLGMPEAERAELWRTHKLDNPACADTLMRVTLDGEEIETSRRATFPTKFAPIAWRAIKRARDTSTAWKRNGKKIPLGHFQVDEIDASGNVTAGCHFVKFDEIERIARALNLEA